MDTRSKVSSNPSTPQNPTIMTTPKKIENMTVDEKLNMLLLSMQKLEAVPSDIVSMRNSIDDLQKDIKEIPAIQQRIATIETDLQGQKETTDKQVKTTEAIEVSLTNTQKDVDDFVQQIQVFKAQLNDNKKTIDLLEAKIIRDEKKILDLSKKAVEEEKARQNVATMLEIQGVPEDPDENLNLIVRQFFFDTGVKVDSKEIDEVYRDGTFNRRKTRSIIVTLTKASTRNEILKYRQEIKRNPNCKYIWMNEVVLDQVKTQRNELHALHILAIKNGHSSKHILDTLVVDGITYSHGSIHRLPVDISLEAAYTREIDNSIYFNSEHVFLSNFSPCTITLQDVTCSSLEQAYFYTMAKELGNLKIAQMILETHLPREIKKLGAKLVATIEWNRKSPQVMFDLLTIKFQQNPNLKERLLATGDKKLVKSTQSKFWGCGLTIPMIDRQIREHGQVKSTGKNTLGEQLEGVRRDLEQPEIDN